MNKNVKNIIVYLFPYRSLWFWGGAVFYVIFMFLLWAKSMGGGDSIEPFKTIAFFLGISSGEYKVLNYPMSAEFIPLHYFIWILWGGMIGVGVKKCFIGIYQLYYFILTLLDGMICVGVKKCFMRIYQIVNDTTPIEVGKKKSFTFWICVGIIGSCLSLSFNVIFIIIMYWFGPLFTDVKSDDLTIVRLIFWGIYFVSAICTGILYKKISEFEMVPFFVI